MNNAVCCLVIGLLLPATLSAQEAKLPAPRILAGHTGRVMHLAFLPDSKTLLSCCYYKKLLLWDVHQGKVASELREPNAVVMALAVHPDGKTFATGGLYENGVSFWDVEKKRNVAIVPAHAPNGPRAIGYAADGKTMISGGSDLCVWELGEMPRVLKTVALPAAQGVNRLALSPDGKLLAWGSFGPRISLWEPATEKKLSPLYTTEEKTAVLGLAFRTDGKILAGAGKQIHLWDFTGGDLPIAGCGGHEGFIHAISFRPNSNLLISAGQDATVRLWDIGTQKSLATLPVGSPAISLAVSPDGKSIAVGAEDGKIRVYDIASVNVPLAKVAGVSGKKLEIASL